MDSCLHLPGHALRHSLAALRQPRPTHSSGSLLLLCRSWPAWVLLIAGALLFRSFWNIQNQRLGMHTGSVLTATFSLGQKVYPTRESQMAFFQQISRQLRYGPGVSSLAISDSLPPAGYHQDQIYAPIVVAGRPMSAAGDWRACHMALGDARILPRSGYSHPPGTRLYGTRSLIVQPLHRAQPDSLSPPLPRPKPNRSAPAALLWRTR